MGAASEAGRKDLRQGTEALDVGNDEVDERGWGLDVCKSHSRAYLFVPSHLNELRLRARVGASNLTCPIFEHSVVAATSPVVVWAFSCCSRQS